MDYMSEKKPYIVDGERISHDEYTKIRYEDLRVRVPKGRKDEIQAHAADKGESLNGFVNRAIDSQIERDKGGE
jgi:predicted HicB family RNase H-like nuclease